MIVGCKTGQGTISCVCTVFYYQQEDMLSSTPPPTYTHTPHVNPLIVYFRQIQELWNPLLDPVPNLNSLDDD